MNIRAMAKRHRVQLREVPKELAEPHLTEMNEQVVPVSLLERPR